MVTKVLVRRVHKIVNILMMIWSFCLTAALEDLEGASNAEDPPIVGTMGLHPGYDPPCYNSTSLNSFLWTVHRDPSPPAYFFGSIHVPFTKVWNFIPPNTKQAFQRADNVYFELDLTDHSTISSLASCQLLPEGQRLANVIPQDVFKRLKKHLKKVKNHMPQWMTADQRSRGLYADYLFNAITGNWEHKRPVWVMLMVNSLTENSVKTKGIPVLDLYLAQEAKRLAKQTGAVEKVEEHCIPLNELNFSQALFTLNQTLWQQEQMYRGGVTDVEAPAYTTADLINHYNCGDLDTVVYSTDSASVPNIIQSDSLPPAQLAIAEGINQYFHDELIYKRNQRMANRVAKLLRHHPNESFFFAFGAGHFLGNSSVIDKLRTKGFHIKYTEANEDLYFGENYTAPDNEEPLQEFISTLNHGSSNPAFMPVNFNDKKHRERHTEHHENRRKKKRRKEHSSSDDNPVPTDSDRLKRPQFNDLWVRLEATSFGPNSLFRRLQSSSPSTTAVTMPKYAMYNECSRNGSPTIMLYSFVTCLILLIWCT